VNNRSGVVTGWDWNDVLLSYLVLDLNTYLTLISC